MDRALKKISVVVPNYNYAHYLPGRIASIISQTYPIYEVIILDDCSKDNSIEVIQYLVDKYPKVNIRVEVNNENSGSVFKQWNKGIELAKGDYIWIAEADDLCSDTFLEKVVQGFYLDNDVVLSYCQSNKIDAEGKIFEKDYLKYTEDIDSEKWKNSYLRNGIDEVCDSLVFKNTIPNASGVVFKKIDMAPILEMLKQFKVGGDWFFYTWLLQSGKIYFCSEILNQHRFHTNTVREQTKVSKEVEEVIFLRNFIRKNFRLNLVTIEKIKQEDAKLSALIKFQELLESISNKVESTGKIGIYGTKFAAEMVIKHFLSENMSDKICCLIERSDQENIGEMLKGIPIVTLEEAQESFGINTVIVGSYLNHKIIYDRIKYLENDGVKVIVMD